MKPKILVSWSGGKDCALALRELQHDGRFVVSELLTTFVEGEEEISGHRIPLGLIELQAEALGIPLRTVGLPPAASNRIYEERLGDALRSARARGRYHAAFGDLFLEDIRAYRERLASAIGVTALFPLWGRDTALLAGDFLSAGFQALVVAVDREVLPAESVGRPFDRSFLESLPAGVDPCGERGEFHTFVFGGPIFRAPLEIRAGRPLSHGRYEYCEVLPESRSEPLE